MGIFSFKRNKSRVVENVLSVEGNANDLLDIDNEMKQTRLFYLMPESFEENQETFDITITSTNPYECFPIFDKMLGKKIRITVDIVEE